MCHDPDWGDYHNDGATIDAKLTTHDAGNKVTLLDFTMAENMNYEASLIQKAVQFNSLIPIDVEPAYWTYAKYIAGFCVFTYFWFIATKPYYRPG